MTTDCKPQEPEDSRAGFDLIWGVSAIAKEINQSKHATYYMLAQRRLPAKKVGDKWVAVRSRLKAHFDPTTGAA
jgi:hypothetical protein